MAINKASTKEDAFSTLTEAIEEKHRKYSYLGNHFQPLILSAGGLIERDYSEGL